MTSIDLSSQLLNVLNQLSTINDINHQPHSHEPFKLIHSQLNDLLELNTNPTDKKQLLELVYHQYIHIHKSNVNQLLLLINYIVYGVQSKHILYDTYLAFTVYEYVFDLLAIQECETIFLEHFTQRHIHLLIQYTNEWDKSRHKLILLRICNTLLKRCNKTTQTNFCGDILLLLSNVLPVCERSGVNITGKYNMNNTTQYDTTNSNKFYNTLWSVQSYLNTSILTSKDAKLTDVTQFVALTTEIIDIFSNYQSTGTHQNNRTTINNSNSQFYPKYITNIDLLPLQLQNTDFRITILLQIYVILYSVQIKLSLKVQSTVDTLLMRIDTLIAQSNYNIKKLIQHEQIWVEWKNKKCVDYTRTNTQLGRNAINYTQRHINQPLHNMGSERLSGIWSTDNVWNHIVQPSSVPDLNDTLIDLIDDNMDDTVELEEKDKLDHRKQWRVLRQLMRHNPSLYMECNGKLSCVVDKLTEQRTGIKHIISTDGNINDDRNDNPIDEPVIRGLDITNDNDITQHIDDTIAVDDTNIDDNNLEEVNDIITILDTDKSNDILESSSSSSDSDADEQRESRNKRFRGNDTEPKSTDNTIVGGTSDHDHDDNTSVTAADTSVAVTYMPDDSTTISELKDTETIPSDAIAESVEMVISVGDNNHAEVILSSTTQSNQPSLDALMNDT